MAEMEIRATHEQVEGFVEKLRDFYRSLDESEQAMLETIVESAQGQDIGELRHSEVRRIHIPRTRVNEPLIKPGIR